MNDIFLPESALTDRGHRTLRGSSAVIVLGMHRSGTSALAGMLQQLGVEFGTRLMQASPANPRGYWEHLDIVAVHHRLMAEFGRSWDDIRPMPAELVVGEAGRRASRALRNILERDFAGVRLWGVKDPRMCRLLGLWLPLMDELGAQPRFLLAVRHPADVAASLAARDGLAVEHALLLWLRHVLEAERATRDRRRAIVHYEDLVAAGGWQAYQRIGAGLEVAWPNAGPSVDKRIENYLAPELHHHQTGDAHPLPGWVEAVYRAFVDNHEIGATCDAIAEEIDRADQIFLPLISAGQTPKTGGQGSATELAERLARAEHNAAELRAVALRQKAEIGRLQQHPAPAIERPPAAADAYPQWIASRASTAVARPEWIAERVREWPLSPKMALGMVLPAGTEARLSLTLESLRRQVVGDWVLHVVAETDPPDGLAPAQQIVWRRAAADPVAVLNRSLISDEADWIALIDGGDQLASHALFSVAEAFLRHAEWGAVYSDEDRIDLHGNRSGPHFKPDFNLELLRSLPYVGGLLAVRRTVFAELAGFDPARDGTEEYDLALRLAERLGGVGFGHIADVLYHRLTISGRSKRPVEAICADMPAVVQAHLDRCGVPAVAEPGIQPQFCRVRYRHAGPDPLVSIIVPTKDRLPLLKRCVETVLKITRYENYELIIVDNGSREAEACNYLQNIEDKFAEIGSRIRVLRHPGDFNFAAMNNRAVREAARGEYVCLLNNDAAPLAADWLSEMMALARCPDVGAVGAKLFFPDGRLQHAGVILGIGWGAPAEHPYNGEPGNAFGYWGRAQVAQELSAVTAACLVTRRAVYEEAGGLDEETFAVSYNDVDFCLRVGAAGYRVVWTPFALLLHEANASLNTGVDAATPEEKRARFARERAAMYQRWLPRIAADPAYSRNLSTLGGGFAVETEGPPTWDPEFRPRPRIIAYAADREGCGEYRIIAPSRTLFATGRAHSCETMRLATLPEIARIAPESIVLQRQLEPHQLAFIEQVKHYSGAFRVFELDDLITNLPPKSVHRKAIPRDIAERLRKALGLCDRLVVSTQPLAQAYGKLCGEVVVMPNRLERGRWIGLSPGRRPAGRPRVGWAGAAGHSGDLGLIAEVVQATAREVDWVFFGMCPDQLRRHVAEAHPWVPIHDYAAKLASLDLDLAVAPLQHHPFNEAKSNLRLLEYGILGYPVICTDIAPYRGDLPVTRVPNRPQAWIKAIRDMAADRAACEEAGQVLRAAVLKDWMLDDHLEDVVRAWLP